MKKSRKFRRAQGPKGAATELADDRHPGGDNALVARTYDLYANFDGACWPNPGGCATWGFVIENDRHETVMDASGTIGSGPHVSNNVAEYAAILQALRAVEEMAAPGWRVLVRGDSNLVIRQMSGQWKAKRGLYLETCMQAQKLLDTLKRKSICIELQWVPREKNGQADALTEAAYNCATIDNMASPKRPAEETPPCGRLTASFHLPESVKKRPGEQ